MAIISWPETLPRSSREQSQHLQHLQQSQQSLQSKESHQSQKSQHTTIKRVTPVTKVTTGTTDTTITTVTKVTTVTTHNSHNSIRRALWANFSSVVTGLDYSGKTDGILVSRRQLNFTLTGSEKTSGSALEDKHKWRVKLEWLMIMYIPSIEKNLKSWPCRNGKFHYFFLF